MIQGMVNKIVAISWLGLLLFTGCNPNSHIILSDDASLRKLNDRVKDQTVRVTTDESVIEGDNITVGRDSTIVEKYSSRPGKIPSAAVKQIQYFDGYNTSGLIFLYDEHRIKARDIIVSLPDSSLRFDEIITSATVFPTKKLLKIQIRNHFVSALRGMGMGIWMGAATGLALGTFIGHVDDVPDGKGPDGSGQGMSRVEIMFGSCMMGALAGPVLGSIVGAAVGQWENIAVTCEFK